MKIAIPVIEQNGAQSRISRHFGRCPFMALLESDAPGSLRFHDKSKPGKEGAGGCLPLDLLQAEKVEQVWVGGIGQGAFQHLLTLGVSVHYLSDAKTVAEALEAFSRGELIRLDPEHTCVHESGHHGRERHSEKGHDCGHHGHGGGSEGHAHKHHCGRHAAG